MLLSILALAALPTQAADVPAQPDLTQIIAARDAELFSLAFGGCDPERLRTMVTDDLEFYHDRGGLTYRSGDEMVEEYAKQCEEKKSQDRHSRRELVTSSLHVDPVPGYGAMEAGEHLFYEQKGDEPERLVGRALFAHVWRLEDGTWKISRVLSYAHRPAEGK